MSEDYLKDLETYKNEPKSEVAEKEENRFVPKADPVLLRMRPVSHSLSVEEQILFIRITEGIFGYSEQTRNESLHSVAKDYNTKFLAPHLCEFARDAIHLNLAYPDLSLLIYSIRLVKSLLANPETDLKRHLHILLPAVLSCVMAKKISKHHYDNHWTLRDFSAQVVASICLSYSNQVNRMKERVTKVYLRGIQDYMPLNTIYGGLKGLSCFGEETVRALVVPAIPRLSMRVCGVFERAIYKDEINVEAKQCKRVADTIIGIAAPVLLKYRNTNDNGVQYTREFGYLGYSLYTATKNLEKNSGGNNNYNVYLVCSK